MKKLLPLFIILGVVGLLAIVGMGSYNGLVSSSEEVDGSWAEVQTAYQRRFDLIPNLVETVKGYADFEKSTLLGVTEARAAAMGAMKKGDLQGFESANQNLGVAMGRFFGYTENYPDLKANENFRDLQAQLEGTENRIAVARDRFNQQVKTYNTKVKRFPGNLFAGMFGFEERAYFESSAGADAAPEVKF
ncbi:MAG: LemA family protein [Flavobacteriales bacterium]